MARRANGQVITRQTKRGTVYALRFRAGGQRRYVTLGAAEEGWNRQKAEAELRYVLADVERGKWTAEERRQAAEEKPHVVYFIATSEEGPVKVGYTRDLESRLAALQAASPTPLRVLGVISEENARAARSTESLIHHWLANRRLNGEWFDITAEDVNRSIWLPDFMQDSTGTAPVEKEAA